MLEPLAAIEDVEAYLGHNVPASLVDLTNRKIGATSNVLRKMYQLEDKDLDQLVANSPLDAALVREAIAVSVSLDIQRRETTLDSPELSSFSSFTQSAGGYTFTGEWRGNDMDVFISQNQLKNLGIGRSTISRFML